MLSRGVWAYPDGGNMPLPGPPVVLAAAEPAGTSGPLPCSRFGGRDDTLTLVGPVGAGDLGYTGRDVYDPAGPVVPESHGMFYRLHQEGATR
jgi:hypothetical protein